ncbi:hypothetical protein [Enterocloster lavalensis]|uniref:Uncharacterized protein n=1 Tax=Enterocloster lavalensis TaxID=460384 RepID=A0A1I0IZD1_9FIRM|nr:hypothetical protein [Enterocloster lavalensis]MCB6343236.1 hypothetical protein [Enterocloster lavalensis]SEU02054.1 hypothetical protein SAMN05216313_12487 [Enterocloster lavalensis]
MALTAKQEYEAEKDFKSIKVRRMVLQAISQANEGRTKDLNEVCERLEKKYSNA